MKDINYQHLFPDQILETITHDLYSSGVTDKNKRATLFKQTLCDSGVTFVNTNMYLPNILPTSVRFVAKEIICVASSKTSFRLIIGCKEYTHICCSFSYERVPIISLMLTSENNFKVEAVSDREATFVTCVLRGDLIRPTC
jgi:hypothetical protein